jgi:hypothetical protein
MYDSKRYADVIEICIKFFGDSKLWLDGFGGNAWKKIAESIFRLTKLEFKFLEAKQNKNMDDEIQAMKDIVIELNVFDGLAHNTDSIIKNIINIENINSTYAENQKRYIEIRRMMNSKELRNSTDVYYEIQPTLKGSGDINRYKDWTGRITRQPAYYKPDHISREKELIKIELKKKKPKLLKLLNEQRSYIEEFLFSFEDRIDNKIDIDQLLKGIRLTFLGIITIMNFLNAPDEQNSEYDSALLLNDRTGDLCKEAGKLLKEEINAIIQELKNDIQKFDNKYDKQYLESFNLKLSNLLNILQT